MIQQVLPVIVEELNDYLKSNFHAIEDKAVLSNIIDQDGSIAVESGNKIVATLLSIDRDATSKGGGTNQLSGSTFTSFAPAVNVNLTIMFSAMFSKSHYIESLRYISGVIYFFQNKPLFTSQNTPKLARGVDKLYLDMLSLSPQELMNLYSMLGAKLMPSVLYKIRMLTFSQDNIVDELPAITGIENNTNI
jgi:Pvc16 N-terminal domain